MSKSPVKSTLPKPTKPKPPRLGDPTWLLEELRKLYTKIYTEYVLLEKHFTPHLSLEESTLLFGALQPVSLALRMTVFEKTANEAILKMQGAKRAYPEDASVIGEVIKSVQDLLDDLLRLLYHSKLRPYFDHCDLESIGEFYKASVKRHLRSQSRSDTSRKRVKKSGKHTQDAQMTAKSKENDCH